jgi:hypothetical protein
VTQQSGPGFEDARSPTPPPRRPTGPLLFVIVLSIVVMAFAVLLVIWMYWLGGVIPG